MTVGAGICVSDDGKLMVFGNCVLHDVPNNIVVAPASGSALANGAFMGVVSDKIGSRRIFPVGKLQYVIFYHIYLVSSCVTFWDSVYVRFQIQNVVMTQRMGTCGQDIPFETQFLIVEAHEGSGNGDDSAVYVVFLPILEGDFRAVLQGNERNELEICLESDPAVDEFQGNHLVFMAAGSDPFEVITDAVKSVEKHLKTFSNRERKKMPDMLNWFGWCTWDAFYTNVTSESLKEGLQSFTNRLTNIKENHKFQKDRKEGHRVEDPALALRHIVTEIKQKHALKYAYVWQAITGYWGGVRPDVTEMEHYKSKVVYPISSPGVKSNEPDQAFDSLTKNGLGLGLANPEKVFSFYDELHAYLASAGIDGVKVDVQNILKTLGSGHGGRVKLARKYHQALDAKRTAVIRASDDFWPRDLASHTIHIASVAYNTVFLGEFMQPDWDMFHSLHPMAKYHGAVRAVGGCAIYVGDKPGQHDFNLLRKLVLPDGSILRAKLPGRPTKDCLFSDPARDGKSLLKIWNLNEFTGVIGSFNCQGAGWCKVGKTNVIHDEQPGELVYLPNEATMPITLKAREYEVFTVVPVKILSDGYKFAPIGLIKMFNPGGAIKELRYHHQPGKTPNINMKVRGCGLFGSYLLTRPKRITVDTEEVSFEYEDASGLATLSLRVPKEEMYFWSISIELIIMCRLSGKCPPWPLLALRGIKAISGVTRLTRSGLSMTDWKFTGNLPPLSDEEWQQEFEKFEQSPEYRRVNKGMGIEDFKFIYWMEYAHRMWGRALGVMFALPFSYFLRKGYIGLRLSALFALGAGQGLIGWWMVKSGLEERSNPHSPNFISPFLPAHLTSAFVIYSGLFWTALSVVMPEPLAESLAWVQGAAKVRRIAIPVSLVVGITAVSGAFVAGNDAGRAYITFLKMGDVWVPDNLFELKPIIRNFFENTAMVQLDHRILATSSLISICGLWWWTKKLDVHPAIRSLVGATFGMAALQVTLGVSTLLSYVPVSLGTAHQAGALTLLTLMLLLNHTVRKPSMSLLKTLPQVARIA
ncbi:putative galactinol--sucrose galactosyltransferase 1 [Hibiscus syriacus]|uniref:Galactinol--sucrose galactosyltransferase 1 n=1 Tax=Hibiscus syriacus TaxID=106335 RepID=A0A6A3D2I6_HIBSY|nr:putative galactinol--sucrose galactosyltransferase 1 [Hibiscus syriacus]